MDNDDSTLTIDPDLRERLESLADRSGTSIDDLVNAVLSAHADQQEHLLNELAEDEERWQQYLASGRSIPVESVRTRLRSFAGFTA